MLKKENALSLLLYYYWPWGHYNYYYRYQTCALVTIIIIAHNYVGNLLYPLFMCMLILLVHYTKYIIVFIKALNVTGLNVTNIKIECNTNDKITLIQ